ncbi:MAG: biotin/lipoyl-binding protein, partial [Deltaproteobacteria bacterium]|nr:biotin/lipoyl-binding protein [Deltaproteobacteria bacterium]
MHSSLSRFLGPSALGLTLLCAACVERAEATEDEGPPPVARRVEGGIELSEAARAFVRVEPAGTSEHVAVLRAPARVAYRDGSVAEVGTPVVGRVTSVLVRTGERVEAGQALAV